VNGTNLPATPAAQLKVHFGTAQFARLDRQYD
jgi:hypothetical protein